VLADPTDSVVSQRLSTVELVEDIRLGRLFESDEKMKGATMNRCHSDGKICTCEEFT
jgi:hypothetical protein